MIVVITHAEIMVDLARVVRVENKRSGGFKSYFRHKIARWSDKM